MSLAYFPMYPDDFEADTAHLTLAEDGAYNRLLRLCWRTPGCSIPADREWIYRRLRATSTEDRKTVDIVLDEFFTVSEGRSSNARLTREFLAATEAHERRKSAGAKGGKSKALKTNETTPSNAVAKPKQPEPEPEPKQQQREAAPIQDETDRERLLMAMGADPISGLIGPNGTRLGSMNDMAEVQKWTDLGISHADQCRLIAERRAKMNAPPRSFSYFNGAMADFAAARSKPIPAGNTGGTFQKTETPETKIARWRRMGEGRAVG